MAPDACAAAPRAPHGWLHVQDTCRMPPLLQMSGCMTGTHARRHSITHMAISMLRLDARRHLVLGRSTSCFYMSGCMYCFHARRHLELPETLSLLDS
ncbi:hypothetical protein DY000_02052249 [Brassica cretica]|uniref:Uncharacterized protein n=1 Tax=Brassica cretica TaxID=69181 RepID=A0ABQ7A9E7_BRACR|nr:hypothetical protein DY000_02052249 [Brassica cretica]